MSPSFEMWSKPTKAIFNGVLLYSLAGVLYSIIKPISSLASTASSLSSMKGGSSGGGGVSALSIISYVMLAGIIVGYFLYMQGLGEFGKILEPADSSAIGKVSTAVILVMIGCVLAFIPFIGWIGGILNLIAYILMLMGYSALKSSTTFPEMARSGASLLFVSMILLLVGVVIGFIPIVGGFIAMVLNIIAFILVLVGWSKIKNAVTA